MISSLAQTNISDFSEESILLIYEAPEQVFGLGSAAL